MPIVVQTCEIIDALKVAEDHAGFAGILYWTVDYFGGLRAWTSPCGHSLKLQCTSIRLQLIGVELESIYRFYRIWHDGTMQFQYSWIKQVYAPLQGALMIKVCAWFSGPLCRRNRVPITADRETIKQWRLSAFCNPLFYQPLTYTISGNCCRCLVPCIMHWKPTRHRFYVFLALKHQGGKNKMCHTPGSTPTFTSLNNTCPCTCVGKKDFSPS